MVRPILPIIQMMVQIAFFLRYKRQLQRIRQELLTQLEDMIIEITKEAGGKITVNDSLVQAVFEENSLAFWLDMLLFIEKLSNMAQESAADLFGYSLIMGTVIPDNILSICRLLSSEFIGGGVFLDKTSAEALQLYLVYEGQGNWTDVKTRYGLRDFSRVKEFKIFIPTAKSGFPFLESKSMKKETAQYPSILILGKSFEGKRDDIYRHFAGSSVTNNDFPPLFIRFGSTGLNALIDSYDNRMYPIHADDDVNGIWKFLFRQRFKNDPSHFTINTTRSFFYSLIKKYGSLAQKANTRPVIILENINDALKIELDIVINILREQEGFFLLGICFEELEKEDLRKWKTLFSRTLKDSNAEPALVNLQPQTIPYDLWETGYLCSLLGRYFPPGLIPQLLEESGKSAATISRAISLLYALRIIDTPLDPRPSHKDFIQNAAIALGNGVERLNAMVFGILISWVRRNKISSCIRLLEIIAGLGGTEVIDDKLILQSIHNELFCEGSGALKKACRGRVLELIAGEERAPVFRHITQALLAIHFGSEDEIHIAFSALPSVFSTSPYLKAQIHFCQSLYHLWQRDNDSAMEAVKEATMLCRGNEDVIIAHYYRVFAITSLIQGRTGETINYLGFALENAAKYGNAYDIGIAAFYTATVQLLYGNLSRAETLAEKAHRHFLKDGSPEWADRTRFLGGRVALEAGYYMQAMSIFEDIRDRPDGAKTREKDGLLNAWIYRTKTLGDNPSVPKPENCGDDADLFEIEALYFAGNYEKAVELSGAYCQAPPHTGTIHLYTEQPDWRSGFNQCELLCFSQTSMKERMIRAYHALASSHLNPAGAESLREIQLVLRSGQFPEIDPFDIVYYYAWYQILKQTNASRVDISTAVSVAFKRLQSRSGRIDDFEIRRQYLIRPYWNKTLSEAAKEFKLV